MLNDARSLSQREVDVLALVAEGLSNREVAARLQLSPHTVKTHLVRMCRVLPEGRVNRVLLVAWGLRNRVIP